MTWRNVAASSSLHAAQRADELTAAGDMDGRAVWHRIERAIDELRRPAPDVGARHGGQSNGGSHTGSLILRCE